MNWRYRYTVLVLCLLAFFVTYFARLAISPLVPLVTDDFGVSNTLIGFGLTGMWLAYGLAQFPSGILADRFGEKPVVLVAVGGTALASLLLAVSPRFVVFVVCIVLLGGVAGLHYTVATTLLSRTFDDLGTAIGIHSIGGPLAGLIAPVVATWVGVRYGWRLAVVVTAVVGAAVFVPFVRYVRPTAPRRPAQPMRDRLAVGPLADVLTRPSIAFTLVVAMVGTYVAQGLLSFLPTFLVDFREYSATTAGVAFSGFFLVRTVGQVIVGRASDRYGRDGVIAGTLLAGAAGLVLTVAAGSRPVILGGVLLAGVGSSFFAALDPRFMDALDSQERGTGFGLVRTVYTVVGAAGSAGVGVTADRFGWAVAFGSLALLSLVSFGVVAGNELLDLGY